MENESGFYRSLEALCDDGFTRPLPEQHVEQLRQSRSARRLYVRYLSLHFWLRQRFSRQKGDLHASRLAELFAGFGEKPTLPWFRKTGTRYAALAAAVFFVLVSTVGWLISSSQDHGGKSPSPTAYAALITKSHDARWEAGSPIDRLGQVVNNRGRLCLKSGLVELRYDSGATVILKGPAVLQVTGSNSCLLESGELVAHVSQNANGFSVQAGAAKIVDLGTSFGVRRQGEKDIQVRVFQGLVQIIDVSGQQPTTTQKMIGNLEAGQAAAVTADESGTSLQMNRQDRLPGDFVLEMPESAETYQLRGSELVAIDGFTRSSSGRLLTDMNGGFGWTEPWQDKTTELTTTEVVVFSNSATSEEAGTAAAHRWLPRAIGRKGPVYASARFRISGPDTICTAWILLFERSRKPGGGEANLMAFGISDRKFSARLAPRDGDLAVAPNSKRLGDFGKYTDGKTHTLVAKLEFNAQGNKERLSLWIDPVQTKGESPPQPDHLVLYDTGRDHIDTVAVRFWEMDGETKGYVDDLKIGTSWQAVAN